MSFRLLVSNKPFVIFWVGRVAIRIAATMRGVALGWTIYVLARQTHDIKESLFLVGMIGLTQFLPMLGFALPAARAGGSRR